MRVLDGQDFSMRIIEYAGKSVKDIRVWDPGSPIPDPQSAIPRDSVVPQRK